MKSTVYGIAKTILDGLKDADAQIEYAKTAAGKPDVVNRHIEEAKRRLTGVKEWCDIMRKEMGDKPDPIAEVYLDLMLQWHRNAVERIVNAKPGA